MTMPQQLPSLYLRLLRDITDDLVPPRRTRINRRVDKRKMPKFGHSHNAPSERLSLLFERYWT